MMRFLAVNVLFSTGIISGFSSNLLKKDSSYHIQKVSSIDVNEVNFKSKLELEEQEDTNENQDIAMNAAVELPDVDESEGHKTTAQICNGDLDFQPNVKYKNILPQAFVDVSRPGEMSLKNKVKISNYGNAEFVTLLFVVDGNLSPEFYDPATSERKFSFEISFLDERGAFLYNFHSEIKDEYYPFTNWISGVEDGSDSSSFWENGEDVNFSVSFKKEKNENGRYYSYVKVSIPTREKAFYINSCNLVYEDTLNYDYVPMGISLYASGDNYAERSYVNSKDCYTPYKETCMSSVPSKITRKGDEFYMDAPYGDVPYVGEIMQDMIAHWVQKETIPFPLVIVDDKNLKPYASIGLHQIVFNGAISLGHYQDIKVNINVLDNVAPVITRLYSDKVLQYSYNNVLGKEGIIKKFDIKDNSKIKKVWLSLTDEELKTVGEYNCKIYAEDEYGNIGEHDFKLNIYDHEAPQFVNGPDSISVARNNPISSQEIVDLYTVIDDYYGNIRPTIISDNYHNFENVSTPGTYSVTLRAVDPSNNKTEKTLLINVTDSLDELFIARKGRLTIYQNTKMSYEKIIETLKQTGYIDKENFYDNISKLDGFDINGDNLIGDYTLTLKAINQEGQFEEITVEVEVIKEKIPPHKEDNQNSSDGEDINDTTQYSSNKFIAFFQKMFASIKTFFVKLFNW